jgi:hypothetical protein
VGEEPPFVRLNKFMSNGWWFLLRTDGREQLRAAVQMLENIGMEAYVGRARRELRAAGGTARQAETSARPAGPDWPPVLASLQIRAPTARCDDGAVAILPRKGHADAGHR